MNDLTSLCLTCLSDTGDGACISKSMFAFLREELHFKWQIVTNKSPKLVCRKCYRTLMELRRFYMQLRDVELYLECQIKTTPDPSTDDMIEEINEVEEAFTTEMNSTDCVTKQMKLDPILVESVPALNEDFELEEDDPIPDEPKASETPVKSTEKKFVCQICSTFFSSMLELRSHASTHTSSRNTIPACLPTTLQTKRQPKYHCSDCGARFDLMNDFKTHQKRHELDKRKPFRCGKCNRRFLTNDALRDHELVHRVVQMCQCEICDKRYLNESSLEAHMRVAHNVCDYNADVDVVPT